MSAQKCVSKGKRASVRKKTKKLTPAFPTLEWGKDGEDDQEPNLDNTVALTPGREGSNG